MQGLLSDDPGVARTRQILQGGFFENQVGVLRSGKYSFPLSPEEIHFGDNSKHFGQVTERGLARWGTWETHLAYSRKMRD